MRQPLTSKEFNDWHIQSLTDAHLYCKRESCFCLDTKRLDGIGGRPSQRNAKDAIAQAADHVIFAGGRNSVAILIKLDEPLMVHVLLKENNVPL